jgi:Arginase family
MAQSFVQIRAPVPGGLSFYEAADLLSGLADRGRVVGMSVAEHPPSLDVNGITALSITRLIVTLTGSTVRARAHSANTFAHCGHSTVVSSSRHTGPFKYMAPSNRANAGTSPETSQ